jgi:hypothetical protein
MKTSPDYVDQSIDRCFGRGSFDLERLRPSIHPLRRLAGGRAWRPIVTIIVSCVVLLLAGTGLAQLPGASANQAQQSAAAKSPVGTTWYVSRNGNNTTATSWATAWNELNAIKWSSVKPGDTILLDGGPIGCVSPFNATSTTPYDFPSPKPGTTCGMTYNTTLSVGSSGTAGLPITIKLASDVGHGGTAVVFGGRTSSLPACTQKTYRPTFSGNHLDTGIAIGPNSYVVVDGTRRSGIVIYGAGSGINFGATASFVTLQNLEIFDNGVYVRGRSSWYSDQPGIWMRGHNLTFSRLLVHDNGQDDIQDDTLDGVGQSNVTVTDSWLYFSRENPLQPGWGFNTGNNEPCMHPDGIQTWDGGTQTNLTVENSVFGPYLGQGVYPSDSDTGARWNNVTLKNLLFFNVWYDSINASNFATTGWTMSNITSYKWGPTPDGTTGAHLDGIRGSGHVLTNSIVANATNDLDLSGITGSGNIYNNTDPVPGGSDIDPEFAAALATGIPHWSDFQTVDLTAQCAGCAGKGSTLHTLRDILVRIDLLNAADGPDSNCRDGLGPLGIDPCLRP